MSYTLTTQVIGAEELRKALSNTWSVAKEEVAKALNKAANDVQNEAVNLAPKDTGKLKSSIHTEYATPATLTAKVGTKLVYARAQEYGTVGMEIYVSGRRIKKGYQGITKPYTFTGNIKPKFYMKQAMENIRPKFSSYLEEAARRIIQHMYGK